MFHQNATSFQQMGTPFYYSPKETLISGIRDAHLVVASPVLAYWIYSLFFHMLDMSDWQWVQRRRIHESEEVQKKNRVTRSQVVWAVLFQHAVQTVVGLFWVTGTHQIKDHPLEMNHLATILRPFVFRILGATELAPFALAKVTYYAYWWFFPALRLLLAMFFIDTWQYTLHRAMHVNKFLYRHLHSWHHRLYVPYAFGSLYNHPLEGFLLDTLGALLAESVTGLSIREALLLFTVSTCKTVDDHCGYRLPLDPFQLFFANTADYHDIHHQMIGIKSNFSQPFFIHWDAWLGTKMTRAEMERRKQMNGVKTE